MLTVPGIEGGTFSYMGFAASEGGTFERGLFVSDVSYIALAHFP